MTRHAVLVSVGMIATFTVGIGAQSADTRQTLLAKAKEIYGGAAPSSITFKTVAPDDLPVKAKGGSIFDKGKAGIGGGIDRWPASTPSTQIRVTSPGEGATGVLLQDKGNQAYVDAAPCAGEIMVFTQPYTKTEAKPVTCDGKTIPSFKFVQGK